MKQAEINRLLTGAAHLNSKGKTTEAKKLCRNVLAQREKLQAFSSCFTGTSSLPALNVIEKLGYADSEMALRRDLIHQRLGRGNE